MKFKPDVVVIGVALALGCVSALPLLAHQPSAVRLARESA